MLFSVFAFTADPWDNHGRHSPLRMHFHSAIFRSELNLVVAHLLHVRVPFPSFRHPNHHLLGDDDTTVLLSLMRRGKSIFFLALLLHMSRVKQASPFWFVDNEFQC